MYPIDLLKLMQLLDAIVWTVKPYYDSDNSLEDFPWLRELAESYNSIVDSISKTHSHSYTKFNF